MESTESTTQPAQSLTCIPAIQSEVPALIDLQYAACEGYTFHDAIWGLNTSANRQKSGNRLLEKWQTTPEYSVVKCIDTTTDSLMAWCIWDVIPACATRADALKMDVMNDCTWLPEGAEREHGLGYLVPAIEMRWEVMAGEPYLLLTNVCTGHEWRGKGAAKALVRWGLEKAKEMRLPAYCEASEDGKYVYERVGFEKVGVVETVIEGQVVDECAVMVAGS